MKSGPALSAVFRTVTASVSLAEPPSSSAAVTVTVKLPSCA
jgi:hypothetical protein